MINPKIEEIKFQVIETINAKICAKEILPVRENELNKLVSADKIPSDKIGEKSICPNRKIPRREKKFKYGSHTLEKKLVTLYGKPGIQVIIIRATHKNE